jgi:hypothetical protein
VRRLDFLKVVSSLFYFNRTLKFSCNLRIMFTDAQLLWKAASVGISRLIISTCCFQNFLAHQNQFSFSPCFLWLNLLLSQVSYGVALGVRGRCSTVCHCPRPQGYRRNLPVMV